MIKLFEPSQWQVVYDTSTTQSSWPAIAPTATKPVGDNVFIPSGSRVLLTIAGDGTGGNIGIARIIGWRKVGTVYYPEFIGSFSGAGFTVASGIAGDGVDLPVSHVAVAGTSSPTGNVDEDQGSDSAGTGTGYEIGWRMFPHNGPELVQIDIKRAGFGTVVNGLVTFI